jgi:hypothetical protein
MLKLNKSLIMLSAIILLTSCGTPETTLDTTTPANTTASMFEVSTAAYNTTNTITTISTPPETTTMEIPPIIYGLSFPYEFSENYSFGNGTKHLTEKDYEAQVSPEAEKLFNDYLTFATDNNINAEFYDPEHPSYYENGCFYQYPSGRTYYGLVDINSDGVPEVFKFFTYGDRNSSIIYFYDFNTKKQLSDTDIYGFNLDEGATYFGKNKDGNLLICKGHQHSNYEGFIRIGELLIDQDAEKLTYNETF